MNPVEAGFCLPGKAPSDLAGRAGRGRRDQLSREHLHRGRGHEQILAVGQPDPTITGSQRLYRDDRRRIHMVIDRRAVRDPDQFDRHQRRPDCG